MAPPKAIYTLFNGEDHELNTLEFSFLLSKKFNAHLFVWHIIPEWEDFSVVYPVYGVTPMMMDWTSEEINKAEEEIQNIRKITEQKLNICAKEVNYQDYSYIAEKGDAIKTIETKGRLSDLFILPRPCSQNKTDALISSALFGCRKPTLLVPPEEKLNIDASGNVLVAWDGSVEASNAVISALPFLINTKVHIVYFEETFDSSKINLEELTNYLNLHNIETLIVDPSPYNESVSKNILNLAEDLNADLIITGGWSHNRLTEMVLGGVTKFMYYNANRPVYIYH